MRSKQVSRASSWPQFLLQSSKYREGIHIWWSHSYTHSRIRRHKTRHWSRWELTRGRRNREWERLRQPWYGRSTGKLQACREKWFINAKHGVRGAIQTRDWHRRSSRICNMDVSSDSLWPVVCKWLIRLQPARASRTDNHDINQSFASAYAICTVLWCVLHA